MNGWRGPAVLDDMVVPSIAPSLDAVGRVHWAPQRLMANAGRAFQGSLVLGEGFLVSEDEARQIVSLEPSAKAVLKPCLNADELMNRPDQTPSRLVIDFEDRSEEEARQFQRPFEMALARVYPAQMARDRKSYAGLHERWWQFWRPRRELYEAIQGLPRVLVGPQTAKWWAVSFLPNGWVYTHALTVFAFTDDGHAAVLSSTFHEAWARRHSGSLKCDLRYSPTDCFQNFPFPRDVSSLEGIGELYLSYRRETSLAGNQGLTQVYNRLHERPEDRSERIEGLRQLRRELDRAVVEAYGWSDLELDHDFREIDYGGKKALRFTISDALRVRVLDRLLELNHERYADEVRRGLHVKGKEKRKRQRAGAGNLGFTTLFGDD